MLLHQDAEGAYVERLLIALRALLPSCKINSERLDAPGAFFPS